MYPSIQPQESLLLDTDAVATIGDVIVFENRFGVKIAHRLVHTFAGYYFTRGDNCRIINFPCKTKSVFGVVMGKKRDDTYHFLLKLALDVFLFQYLLYSVFFDTRKKRGFLLLKAASVYLAPERIPGLVKKTG